MTDRIFLRLSAKFALGADELQWIVYQSRHKVPSPLDAPLKLEAMANGSRFLLYPIQRKFCCVVAAM